MLSNPIKDVTYLILLHQAWQIILRGIRKILGVQNELELKHHVWFESSWIHNVDLLGTEIFCHEKGTIAIPSPWKVDHRSSLDRGDDKVSHSPLCFICSLYLLTSLTLLDWEWVRFYAGEEREVWSPINSNFRFPHLVCTAFRMALALHFLSVNGHRQL